MPNSGVSITPGAGANIAVNPVGGLDYQTVKIDAGADGASYPLVGDGVHGLPVDVQRVLGVVVVNNPTAVNLKVDASGATVPISAASAIPVSALVSAPAFVRLSDGTNPIATLPVSGTVTANQGTAAAAAGAWPVEISDGTSIVSIANVGGNKALNVNVLATTGAGAQADKSTFTEGTTNFDVMGGEFNDSATSPASGQAAAVRITPNRACHVNLRNQAGTEIGTVSNPVQVAVTNPLPVSGTVTATISGTPAVNLTQIAGSAIATAATGVAKVSITDGSGNAFSATNPLQAVLAATPSGFWKTAVSFTASQTAQVVHTPSGGKTAFIEGFIVTVITSGVLQIFDQTNAAANMIYQGTPPVGAMIVVVPTRPIPSSAVNNVIRYTTGTGATGDVVAWGFDA